jgi:HlyD family secretion protein
MTTKNSDHFVTFYKRSISILSQYKTYTALVLVSIVAIGFYVLISVPKVEGETGRVTFGTLKQYVNVSGQVTSSKDANLSFQTTGAVAYVGVKSGDKVQQGKVLATLNSSDAQAQVLQAEAGLASAQALLGQLEQGSRREEIALKEQLVVNAKNSLDQSYSALPDTIQNVDAVTADIVKNKLASLFIISNGRFMLSFASCDQKLSSALEEKRLILESTLADFQKKSTVVTPISSQEFVDETFNASYQVSLATNDLVATVSNLLLLPCSLSNTSLDSYRTTLSQAKVSMTSLFADITVKRSSLASSKNVYNQAKKDLELTKAGTDPYRIKAQVAAVSQATAVLAQAKSALAKTIITAPFSGVVSTSDLSLGETVTLGKTVISMIATEGYEVEAKVPEIDIVKVTIGAPVEVTLDAYGKDIVFPATVTRIYPTAISEGSVPMYKVIITFTGTDERIKQGMTANVHIITENKQNTLLVPARFVVFSSSKEGVVTVLKNGRPEEKTITVGARGADGQIEVLAGVATDDVLVAPTTKDRQAQKQTK